MSPFSRTCCALVAGAQIFFAAVAAQQAFPREVAALPREDPRRQLAADLVGAMLARLDAATIVLCAVAVVGAGLSRKSLLPLIAGLLAAGSALAVTPMIHAMRAAGETATPRFGILHGVSSSMLLAEIVLLLVAAFSGRESAARRGVP